MKQTPGDVSILHKCTKNHDHMLYCSWNMVRDRCNCYFSFWTSFYPFILLTSQKIKFFKKWKKKAWRYHLLHMCTKNYDQMMYGSWDMVCNRQTDGWKKWHIEVGAQPKNQVWISCLQLVSRPPKSGCFFGRNFVELV